MLPEVYQIKNPIRFVTATSLYDGHDVSINIHAADYAGFRG